MVTRKAAPVALIETLKFSLRERHDSRDDWHALALKYLLNKPHPNHNLNSLECVDLVPKEDLEWVLRELTLGE